MADPTLQKELRGTIGRLAGLLSRLDYQDRPIVERAIAMLNGQALARVESQAARIAELTEALRGLSDMYVNTWDSVDGALIMMEPGVARFEKAHEAARRALASAEQRG